MPAGRPTKYTEELLERAATYIDCFQDEGDVIPSIAGLAIYLDIGRNTIYTWADDDEKPEFRDILGKILAKQEKLLLNSGLTGDFNSQITKLALGKHGYSDKHDVEVAERPMVTTTRKRFDGSE